MWQRVLTFVRPYFFFRPIRLLLSLVPVGYILTENKGISFYRSKYIILVSVVNPIILLSVNFGFSPYSVSVTF